MSTTCLGFHDITSLALVARTFPQQRNPQGWCEERARTSVTEIIASVLNKVNSWSMT